MTARFDNITPVALIKLNGDVYDIAGTLGLLNFKNITPVVLVKEDGTPYEASTSGGGGGTPGGSDTEVQFNDAGSLGGDAGLTYDKTTGTLIIGSANGLSGLTTFIGPLGLIYQKENEHAQVALRAASTLGNKYPDIAWFHSRGSLAIPSATRLNDNIGAFDFYGYGATDWLNTFSVVVQATENWTDAAAGSSFTLYVTPTGGTAATQFLYFDGAESEFGATGFPTEIIGSVIRLPSLTSNGFVKTSGGDGTLLVDTAMYLTSAVTSAIGTANQINVSGATGAVTFSVPSSAQLGVAKLTNLTTNGFVKTGSADGTLSVDTNTYLTAATGFTVGKHIAVPQIAFRI